MIQSDKNDVTTEDMADAVRGVLQLIRGKPGATFKDVRGHCSLRGDDLSRWPTWIADAEGYVTEQAAARMIYEIMRRHAPRSNARQKCDCTSYNGGPCYNCINGHHEICDNGQRACPASAPSTIEERALSEKEEWCPTQGGSMTAYEPEFRQRYFLEGETRFSKWQRVPTVDINGIGLPYPLAHGGVFRTIGLFGHEQAQALAWQAAAVAAAQGEHFEVRVVPYELKYDIKARKRFDGDHGSST